MTGRAGPGSRSPALLRRLPGCAPPRSCPVIPSPQRVSVCPPPAWLSLPRRFAAGTAAVSLSPSAGMPGPLPPTQLYASERVVVLVSCVLSFLGSSLLVCTHALWPELRTRPRQLLLYLSLADLLSALSYFYGVLQDFDRTSWDCVLQGALSTFSNTSSFFWTMAIALYLYITIVRGSPTGTGLLCCFHAVRWVLSRVPARAGGLDPMGAHPAARGHRVPLRGEALGWLLESPALFLRIACPSQVPFKRGFCCHLTN